MNQIEKKTSVEMFQEDYFSKFSLIDPVIDSYNDVSDKLQTIIEKFQLQYPYTSQEVDHTDEQMIISLALKNPQILLPGSNERLPKTSVEAIARRQDFMCTYEFDVEFKIQLKSNKKQQDKIKEYINLKMTEMDITEINDKNQAEVLEKYFDDFNSKFNSVDEFKIPSTKLTFDLPVMTMSNKDPIKNMSKRQKYDLGCDVNEIGGDIILAGIPYLIQNSFSYPTNLPIIAKSTIPGQLIRADYLYQPDPEYGNFYNSIFILTQNKIKKDKALNVNAGSSIDLVLNFKQRHDPKFKDADNFIPVSLLFRAYGCENDEKILKYCNPAWKKNVSLSFLQMFQDGVHHQQYMGNKRTFSQLEALYEIGKIISKEEPTKNPEDIFRLTKLAEGALSKYIYPIDFKKESPYCQTLGEICSQILAAHEDSRKLTDRDALYNRRFVMVGQQIVGEIRGKIVESFKSAIKCAINAINIYSFEDIKQTPAKIIHNLESAVKEWSKNFSKGLKRSFTTTQNDGVKINKNLNEQKTAYLSVSQKREGIIKSATANGKVGYDQRKLQRSFWAFICYLTTPESGENIGRYLSPTIYSYISIPQNTNKINEFLSTHKKFIKEKGYQDNYMSVKVNYQTKGFVKHGQDFKDLYNDCIKWRHENAFKKDHKVDKLTESADQLFVSIYYSVERNEINICTDSGRILIPIFKKNDSSSFVDKIKSGDAMFIDPAMAQNYIVAEYTEFGKRKEIKWSLAPSACLGILPACNALQNHNKGVRSSLSTAQHKSAQTQPIQNYQNYYLKNMLVINENQSQIIYAPMAKVGFSEVPTTQMIFIAVMPFTDNQEDSMIISEDFIARYGFATTSFTTYSTQRLGEGEQFQMPQQTRKEYNYSKINQNQFQVTKMGTNIKFNDVLIVKTKTLEDDTRIDQSVQYNTTQEGEFCFVCNINHFTQNPIANLKMVRLAFGRVPSIGDKVASTNAQKSVIGKIIPGWQMPITEEGIVINILQNNAPIMRRETYGQILEILCAKYILEHDQLRLQISQDQPIEFLEDLKNIELDRMYQPNEDILFQNPEVLCGPINYTVQKHVVDEKIRVRGEDGKQETISRQSAVGKKNGGGLKIGDMERHAITAGGGSNILKNFFGKLSSNTTYNICTKCGNICCYYERIANQYKCESCGLLLDNQVIKNGYSYNAVLLSHICFASGAQQTFVDLDVNM